jgi:hypothetical protein
MDVCQCPHCLLKWLGEQVCSCPNADSMSGKCRTRSTTMLAPLEAEPDPDDASSAGPLAAAGAAPRCSLAAQPPIVVIGHHGDGAAHVPPSRLGRQAEAVGCHATAPVAPRHVAAPDRPGPRRREDRWARRRITRG